MAIDDNTSYELTGYQVKDLASKIRAKADSNSLASVATSGLYSDLTGAPTIPTVYNGTLTIQQNGTQLGTFSANQSSNTTINITGGGGSSVTNFYYDNNMVYKDSGFTTPANFNDVATAFTSGVAMIDGGIVTDAHTLVVHTAEANNVNAYEYDQDQDEWAMSTQTLQEQLTAGTNVTISSNTISATDTTYSNFTGATSSVAGAHGLVPAPAAGDNTSFLRGDGTWAVPTSFIPDYGATPTAETSPYTSTAHQFVRITTNGGAVVQINDKQVLEVGNNGHSWFEVANGDIVKVPSGNATIYSWPGRWV